MFNQFCNEVSRALKRVTCRQHVTAMQICCMVCKLSHHSLYLDIIQSKLSFLMWSPSGSRKGDLQLKLAAYTTVFLALQRVQMQFCQCCISCTPPLRECLLREFFVHKILHQFHLNWCDIHIMIKNPKLKIDVAQSQSIIFLTRRSECCYQAGSLDL